MNTVLNAMQGFTFGCDPELFVVNENGVYVSAEGLIPGTKAEPHKVPGGAIQVDGMAAEFNIDPADNFEEFHDNINKVVGHLRKHLPKGYKLQAEPAVVFDEAVWNKTPDKAKELGCNPDFNAWTGEVNPPPSDPDNPRLRTASGHIHIGWTDNETLDNIQHIMNCRDLVKQLDWYLGAWSVTVDPDPTRRRLYGKAGACRYKPYGVEYRVLSNFWLTTKERRLNVWNRIQAAIHDMRNNYMPDRCRRHFTQGNDYLISSINQSQLSNEVRYFGYPLKTVIR